MPGLGDAIYHRPFLRFLSGTGPVWVDTAWPDLFSDLPLAGGPPEGEVIAPHYRWKQVRLHGVPGAIARFFPPIDDYAFDLPRFASPVEGQYAVIRAPTLRRGFYAPARNPKAEYIARAAELLSRLGFKTVGVAKAVPWLEWFHGEPPPVDIAYWRGELTTAELLGLVSGASIVVGGPGWTVPAAIAASVPLCAVYGGGGAANAMERLTDPRMDTSRVACVLPDRFCDGCRELDHDCDKTITDFDTKFMRAVDQCLTA